MKNQSTRKLEKDLLKLHTKDLTDTDKLTILHLILDGKIAGAKDMLKPQGVPLPPDLPFTNFLATNINEMNY